MKNEAKDKVRILHILKSIELISDFTREQDFESFIKSELIQSAVIRQFEIIGEAASQVSASTQAKYPQGLWREMKSFRNLLIHEYFRVDGAEIWTTIQHDLPGLKEILLDISLEV